jgi:hypothetical protein
LKLDSYSTKQGNSARTTPEEASPMVWRGKERRLVLWVALA